MLYRLTVRPTERVCAISANEMLLMTALHVLCDFNVSQSIPLNASISFADLASKTGGCW
jgi:hypothetical protein